jgi:LacI family transcriptional regulator
MEYRIVAHEVTVVDVARAAGVSYATVSRVINGKDHVKPEKRTRVLQAMDELGYVANRQARRLAGGRSKIIGLLVPGLDTAYIGEVARGIDQEVQAVEYDLMLYTTHLHHAKESAFVTMLSRGLADGLLLILPRRPGSYLPSLRQRQVPYVLIDHHGGDRQGPSVGATNWQGAYDATQYLIGLGHCRIGFITGTLDLACATDRLGGYRAAHRDAGLPPAPELVCEGDFLQPAGYRGAHRLLDLPERPTAIFASNDVMAFGAMEAARERGLRIPQDISIVGFDDIPQTEHVHPPLTTVRQPLEEMGRAATRMLIQRIDQPERTPERIELPTKLIVRASCEAPPVPA